MKMNYRETMAKLKKRGTAQNRKVYARHGVGETMYGVSYSNQNDLKKKIKVDHGLAVRLWDSGNHDARILATMVADPDALDSKTLDAWVRDLDNYVLTDAFSTLAGRTGLARRKMEAWTKSKQEWIGRAGWLLLARVAAGDEDLPDGYFEPYLVAIEERIHKSRNRVRDAMIMAVINIGLRNPALEKKAVAAAKRIGEVDVDHGETGCKTPNAVNYIERTKAHRAKSKKKTKAKAKAR